MSKEINLNIVLWFLWFGSFITFILVMNGSSTKTIIGVLALYTLFGAEVLIDKIRQL